MNPHFLTPTPHPFSILPLHPSLSNTAPRPSPLSFLHPLLTESHALLTSIPHTFHRDPKPRPSPPSTAPVTLSTRLIPSTTSKHPSKPAAFWASRTSVHDDAPVPGSAAWAEFRAGLRENHAHNEMAYTPSVSAVETLLTWPAMDVEGGWRGVEMQVNLITHTFRPSALIAPRAFLVLAVSADCADDDGGFVTVQIPLDPESDGIPAAGRETIAAATSRRTVFASYASVEWVRRRRRRDGDGRIEWTMATTSEAGGAIPRWVQRSWTMGGVPKAIVADVGLFIGWTAERRARQPGADAKSGLDCCDILGH